MRRARKETHNFSSGFSAGVFVLYIWRNVTGKYGIERKARSPGNRTRPSRFWYGIVGVIGTSREKGIALYGEGRRRRNIFSYPGSELRLKREREKKGEVTKWEGENVYLVYFVYTKINRWDGTKKKSVRPCFTTL